MAEDPAPADTPAAAASPGFDTRRLPEPLLLGTRLAIVAIVVAALHFGRSILVPLALAALLAFLLDPLVVRLRRLQMPRSVAVGIVTLCTLAATAGAALLVGQQVVQLGRNLPQYQDTIETKLRTLRQRIAGDRSLHSASRLIDRVGDEVDATRKALEASGTVRARAPRPVPVQVASQPASSLKALHALLVPVVEPLLTGGIALVLLIFMLLERNDLRDRVMRLAGGGLHPMTDALDEAAQRVSRYLTMQVVVNASYGVPLAIGLWWIGVPGALLWGLLAATLRFMPYLGPVVASAFPLAMAFAVDPGWDMLLWTAALLLTLELVINNLVEPWLYGSSTGLAPVAILLAAAFWTLLWGPVGLVLATPLTVCLVVMGRHLPQLRFLDLLLGRDPVFDAPTRLYQRLLAGQAEAASDVAEAAIAESDLATFYSDIALPALGMAASDHTRVASAEHRHRVATGMGQLLHQLQQDHAADDRPDAGGAAVPCIALRWEADALAGTMLAHALASQGVPAQALPVGSIHAERLGLLDLQGDGIVCLSSFHPDPEAAVRLACRRLLRLHPGLQIVLGLWHAPPDLREPGAAAALGATAVATSLREAVVHVQALRAAKGLAVPALAPPGDGAPADAVATLLPLCRQIDAARALPSLHAAQRAAEIFDTTHGVVWWADDRQHGWQAGTGAQPVALDAVRTTLLEPLLTGAPPAVVPDTARDPRLITAGSAAALTHRFVAAVPLCWDAQRRVGALCLLDAQPRTFSDRELRLLEALAADLVKALRTEDDLQALAGAPGATAVVGAAVLPAQPPAAPPGSAALAA